MNKKITILIIVVINVLLIGALITVYFTVWRPATGGEEGTLTITGVIEEDIVLTIEDLEKLPSITERYLLQGTPTFTANYTGVSLIYLVTEAANVSSNVNIRVKAIDNWSYTLTLDEIDGFENITIAYKKNGDYMKGYNDGGEGPLRLIIPQSFIGAYNAQYCVKYVVALELSQITT